MSKYKNHRWVWVKYNGEIPYDENGQTYEIHHVDGNRENNDISNLMCVSKREHSKIHFDKGEFAAAYAILKRTKGITKDFTGWKHTDKTKKKISESTSGSKNPMYGRTREDRKGKGYWLGKKQPKELVDKRVSKNTGQKRPKQSEALKGRFIGDLNPMFGIKGKNHPRSKPVIDLLTNETFECVAELCRNKGFTKQTFYRHLEMGKFKYL